jgi:hypothetical protein
MSNVTNADREQNIKMEKISKKNNVEWKKTLTGTKGRTEKTSMRTKH